MSTNEKKPRRTFDQDFIDGAVPSFKLEICSFGLGGIVGNEGFARMRS